MTRNISARRGALIALFSALALLVAVAAFDNQGTRSWRAGLASEDDGSVAHSWTAMPIASLSVLDWRATQADGESTRLLLAAIAAVLIAVVLTFLLVQLVCRGVAADRGRWALFVGGWAVTGVAAGVALVAHILIAGTMAVGEQGSAEQTGIPYGHGDTYYTLFTAGLMFGLFAGWLTGLVAVIAYGLTGDDAGADSASRDWGAPGGYDYGYGSPAAAPASGPDYSFSPGSPYSSGSPGPSGSPGSSGSSGSSSSSPSATAEYDESAAEATTQIVPPPQIQDPWGGRSS